MGGGLLKVRAPNRAYLCQPSVPEQSRTTSTLLLLKRRIGNGNTRLRIAESLACSRNFYRTENLCYQFEHGQKLLPQFRKIVCLVGAPSAQAEKQNTHSGRSYARYVQLQRRNTSRKAARKRTPSLTYSTSERTSLDSFRPRTSGIRRER